MGKLKALYIYLFLCCCAGSLLAQEQVAPLGFNGAILHKEKHISPSGSGQKTTAALPLPFFEDFTGYDTWPDNTKWKEVDVYINNTMGVNPVSRGVATFDGLDPNGLPYNQSISTALVAADTLTSLPIGLLASNPQDSLYFSFFYQPQGNGFAPEVQDSLMLFFKKSNGAWIKVWAKEGGPLDTFRQVMIPVKDTSYMHDTFQFMFVNKASLNTNDDVWNVDYIKLDAGRSMADTIINDAAMSINPTYLLNDYSYMPYRQFIADPGKERAAQFTATIRNGYSTPQTITYGYTAREKFNNTFLGTNTGSSTLVVGNDQSDVTMPTYNIAPPLVNLYDNFTFNTKFYIDPVTPTDNKGNDTILHQQIFYNYLAYDDGTAEKAYYLNLFPTLPGKTAVEFHLNRPDSITGVSIYFGRQVPLAYNKYFSVAIYKDISLTGGADNIAYQEDFLIPAYLRNDFYWTYKFDKPVPMPAGTFYIGTIQPALSNSDSLYLGLDVNRNTGNHLYYNVVGYWQPSTIDGALMVRPMLGPVFASDVAVVETKPIKQWFANPNPVHDRLKIEYGNTKPATYQLMDIQGRVILSGNVSDGQFIDVGDLASGVYMMRLDVDKMLIQPQKIIKY